MLGTTSAAQVQVSLYKAQNCQGNAEVVYIDVSHSYCFEGAGGGSFGDFQSQNVDQSTAHLQTWSGTNCEGSSAVFYQKYTGGCVNIPFGSVTLTL